jgi:predicted alpha/beta hydrolase
MCPQLSLGERRSRGTEAAAQVPPLTPLGLNAYARACGWTLARAHARSGDPVAIAAYLGETDEFERSVTNFAVRYADQNERDYAEFVAAIRSGQLTAVEGV